jgi:AAA domain-containing protein
MLRDQRSKNAGFALVVDEAQSLSDELLEEIRLLANIETSTDKLLPVVLAGQPELSGRLNHPSLRQLKQRIAIRCELRPFTLQESASYIASRLKTAGGDAPRIFTREAVALVHDRSRGIARTINVICHNALVTAFAMNRRPITRDMILEVCRDFDLESQPADAFDFEGDGVFETAAQRPTHAALDDVQPVSAANGTGEPAARPAPDAPNPELPVAAVRGRRMLSIF